MHVEKPVVIQPHSHKALSMTHTHTHTHTHTTHIMHKLFLGTRPSHACEGLVPETTHNHSHNTHTHTQGCQEDWRGPGQIQKVGPHKMDCEGGLGANPQEILRFYML